MKQKIIKKIVLQEKGGALVMTLGVLLILSILGVSIGALTIGSYRLSDANRDDTSAYYIAEAGAEMAYEEIYTQVLAVNKPTKDSFFKEVNIIMNDYKNKIYNNFEKQGSNLPVAILDVLLVEEGTTSTYKISSTGQIGNKKRVVQKEFFVNWVEQNTGGEFPSIPEGAALIANENMKLIGQSIDGKAFINTKKNGSVDLIDSYGNWNRTTIVHSKKNSPNEIMKYDKWFKDNGRLPKIEFQEDGIDLGIYVDLLENITPPNITKTLTINDEDVEYKEKNSDKVNIKITGSHGFNYKLHLNSDLYIPKIEILNNNPFVIDTGENNSHYTILIEDMVLIPGHIKILGNGSVNFVIKKSLKISNGSKVNEKMEKGKLVLTYLGTDNLHFFGNVYINGHIIVKEEAVTIEMSNTTRVDGIMLVGSKVVNLSGWNGESNIMLIAPNASVNMIESYKINGTVIANKFQMSGGDTKLIYKKIDTTGFPLLSPGSVNPASKDDIIHAKPILEK